MMKRNRSTPRRTSERTGAKRRASAARALPYAAGPTLALRTSPPPATTKLPDSTSSAEFFSAGADSPVTSDSSISSPDARMTAPSTGTWSPICSSRTSPTTSSATGICCSTPLRMTRAVGAVSTARRSSARLPRSSCTMPIGVLTIRTSPKSASWIGPMTRIATSNRPIRILKRVKTLVTRIDATDRLLTDGTVFTSPRRRRASTCSDLSPVGHGSSRFAARAAVVSDRAVIPSCAWAFHRAQPPPG
jgi:hypothetical protein